MHHPPTCASPGDDFLQQVCSESRTFWHEMLQDYPAPSLPLRSGGHWFAEAQLSFSLSSLLVSLLASSKPSLPCVGLFSCSLFTVALT